jgi:hypothetical protein
LADALAETGRTLAVLPTDRTHTLLGFFSGDAAVMEGRDITDEEYDSGARVCLVGAELARRNGLAPGTAVRLSLLSANYAQPAKNEYAYRDYSGTVRLLDNSGRRFGAFEEAEYMIVGTYSSSEAGRHGVPREGFVIPAASVENSDAGNIIDGSAMRAWNTVFEIPNGMIEEYMEAWGRHSVPGIEITFYDRGYSLLRKGLDALMGISWALTASGLAAALLVLAFFTHLFITKQTGRTATERSLGLTKGQCALSLLAGMALVTVPGVMIGTACAAAATGRLIGAAIASGQETAFNTEFSNGAAQGFEGFGADVAAPASGVAVSVAAGCAILAAAAAMQIAGVLGNLKREPMDMFGRRGE